MLAGTNGRGVHRRHRIHPGVARRIEVIEWLWLVYRSSSLLMLSRRETRSWLELSLWIRLMLLLSGFVAILMSGTALNTV